MMWLRWSNAKRWLWAICAVLCCCAGNAQTSPQSKPAQSIFEFHSGFWINLHHFLYLEAAAKAPQTGPHPIAMSEADAATLNMLSKEKRSAWDAAVSYYATSMIQRDLLFDHDLNAIKNKLEDAEKSPDLANVDIPAPLRQVLTNAAPIYRKYWWERHDAQNRKWIADLQPLLETYGAYIKAALVRIYEVPWPGEPGPSNPVRVDATIYATGFGAYTTVRPTRPTISTGDPSNQGATALEIVFHETSHGMMDKIMEAMNAAEASETARHPDKPFRAGQLWHAVLFYTAGELVAERIPHYVPYADKNGLWARAWHDPERSLIEKDWKPRIEGSVALQAAIAKLVADMAAVPSAK